MANGATPIKQSKPIIEAALTLNTDKADAIENNITDE